MRHFTARRHLAVPGNLELAVRTIAILGGYLYRENAPLPGQQKIREGWTCSTIMDNAYKPRDHSGPSHAASRKQP